MFVWVEGKVDRPLVESGTTGYLGQVGGICAAGRGGSPCGICKELLGLKGGTAGYLGRVSRGWVKGKDGSDLCRAEQHLLSVRGLSAGIAAAEQRVPQWTRLLVLPSSRQSRTEQAHTRRTDHHTLALTPLQVTVHLKGRTECFECQPKPTPKTFPICTLRNTPDRPIHTIVWAKDLLFNRLFGRPDAVTGAWVGESGRAGLLVLLHAPCI